MLGDRLLVAPFDASIDTYDLVICTLGYEKRAVYIAEQYVERARARLALGFVSGHELNYERNKTWLASHAFAVSEGDDKAVREELRSALKRVAAETEHVRLLVDISSMTRRRLAFTLWEVVHLQPPPAHVDFVYSVAEFGKPPRAPDSIAEFGPILPEFAGWPINPQRPMVLILGLGYEADRALGAAELLEPEDCWTFRPAGVDVRYDDTVDEANPGLAEMLRGPEREISYRVEFPWETFLAVLSLTDGITRDDGRRAIILPFGPKIFALTALLTQLHFPGIGVWRVGAGPAQLMDRIPTGTVVGLSLKRRL
jgi:hypothetical protein